ncbi:type II toxin-antitoxin system VapC family toxin [Methylobacterium sp. E-065]|uniref:type II toxin-antitoxin system VapC family toxin n=1 Tax=Methylobacterium sp. E-065 TaxID=2836583 RepID=UPI001FB8A564|nr:type II toxin-antitoxin system VapC family toxin [Methylobacterium sp. E-065]MCJ2019707.1 type II toxin-antitoxin system VapC family toxin [Methylobacterium sp. E-065]
MRVTPDTNVLVRLIVNDDPVQGLAAFQALECAAPVAISVKALCELVWVLRSRYGMPRGEITAAIRNLIATRTVVADRPAIEAGLTMLEAGGDFADGVIAFEGRRLGGETFVSFDRAAIKRLGVQGFSARLLTSEADAR